MGVLSATEKLKILALGKATLKEINELEELAANEPDTVSNIQTKTETETETETEPQTGDVSNANQENESSVQTSVESEPDEKDKRIAELEEQLKEAQANNVYANNDGSVPSFDEQLDNMFKGYRF